MKASNKMTNHIGSDFDSFLKSEGIEIDEEEIKERVKKMNEKEIIELNKQSVYVEGLSLSDFAQQALRMRKQNILEVLQREQQSEVEE